MKRDPITGKPTTFYSDGRKAFDALTGPLNIADPVMAQHIAENFALRRIFDAMIQHACRATKEHN